MGIIQKSLATATITHLTGANNYTWLHYGDGTKELFSKTLQYFEDRLPGFIRVHKMVLVNRSFIEVIELPATKKKSGLLTLKAGLVFPISRRRILSLKDLSLPINTRQEVNG